MSNNPSSLHKGILWIGYNQLISNSIIAIFYLVFIYITFEYKVNHLVPQVFFDREDLKQHLFTGAESFVRNAFFIFFVIKTINRLDSGYNQGDFWVANTFLWGWLLLPIMTISKYINREEALSEKETSLKLRLLAPFTLVGLSIIIWLITIPTYEPFIRNVMGNKNAKLISHLVLISLGFYILMALNDPIDKVFLGNGKAGYILIQSLIVNVVVYIPYYFLKTHLTIDDVAIMMGLSMGLDSVITIIMFGVWVKRPSFLLNMIPSNATLKQKGAKMKNIVIVDTCCLESREGKQVLGIRTKDLSTFTSSNLIETTITLGVYEEIIKHKKQNIALDNFLRNLIIEHKVPCEMNEELNKIKGEVGETDFYIASTATHLSTKDDVKVTVLTKNKRHIKKVSDIFVKLGYRSFEIIDFLDEELFVDLTDKREEIVSLLEEAIEYHQLEDDFYDGEEFDRVEDEAFGFNSSKTIIPLFYKNKNQLLTNIEFERKYYKHIKDDGIEKYIYMDSKIIKCMVVIDIDEDFQPLNISDVMYLNE